MSRFDVDRRSSPLWDKQSFRLTHTLRRDSSRRDWNVAGEARSLGEEEEDLPLWYRCAQTLQYLLQSLNTKVAQITILVISCGRKIRILGDNLKETQFLTI